MMTIGTEEPIPLDYCSVRSLPVVVFFGAVGRIALPAAWLIWSIFSLRFAGHGDGVAIFVVCACAGLAFGWLVVATTMVVKRLWV